MTRRIVFLSKGEDSSSTRYRALQFFERLREADFDPCHLTIAGPVASYVRALLALRKAEIVVVLRKTFPRAVLWVLRKCSKRLVFDLDDAIFCNSDGSSSATRMSRFADMVRVADQVTAGNNFLERAVAPFNRNVAVIPTCVDVEKYAVSAEQPADHFDLVWIGSRSTRKYLEDLLPALEQCVQRVPKLRLKIVADFTLRSGTIKIIPVQWSASSEALELASAHIGVAPMRDDDWSRGKCALKVLQYMAAGLPVVSSAAGVNADIVRPGENGELAGNTHAWVDAIEKLYQQPELRASYGINGRYLVRDQYSIDAVSARLIAVFNQLCASKKPG